MKDAPLLDEIVVIDSDSADATAEVAEQAGATVYRANEIAGEFGARKGKGEALWKSLFVVAGDVLVFVDGDLTRWGPHFVTGLLGPLLADPEVLLVRAAYARLRTHPDGTVTADGGRLTELVARPLINLHWPQLGGVAQPLAGEWAARRSLMESLSDPGRVRGRAVDAHRYRLPPRTRCGGPGPVGRTRPPAPQRRGHGARRRRAARGRGVPRRARVDVAALGPMESPAVRRIRRRWAEPLARPVTLDERPPFARLTNAANPTAPTRRGWPGVSAPGVLRLGRRIFEPDERLIMAIVNRTPDSFFDRGATWAEDAAMQRVQAVVAAGAEIVDIGGVPAAPGSTVDTAEELRRTVPFVAAVRAAHPDIVISVDTWRHEVAREVCAAGADLINDSWGGWDDKLPEVAAEFDAALVCSHAGGLPPRTRPYRVAYADVMADVLDRTLDAGQSRGCARSGPDPHPHRPGARLREEHLALAGGHPPPGGDGGDGLAGAGITVQ